MPLKLLIVDDHSVVRAGLKHFLKELQTIPFDEIDEAGSLHELMEKLKSRRYSHLILDLTFPDGNALCFIPVIQRLYPDVRIIVQSMMAEDIVLSTLTRYGVGYFSKYTEEKEMANLLIPFLQNELIVEKTIPVKDNDNPFSLLSPCELQVLFFWLQGYGTTAIANNLGNTASTIATFKKRIFTKTNTSNTVELINLARVYEFPC